MPRLRRGCDNEFVMTSPRGGYAIAFCAALGLAAAVPLTAAGWTSAKVGPFIVYSEAGSKDIRERAAEIEQFRFSLGELLGRHEFTLHPPLQVFLFRQPRTEPIAPITTRTGATALVLSGAAIPPGALRLLARTLLEQNVGRMPAKLERGLEAFLSTTEVRGARVTWGIPPPPAERDADWALVDWLVTNPETYGKFRVLLANAQNNVDEQVAYRNALGKSPADVAAEVRTYLAAGVFPTIDGPSRPLSPERDLVVHPVEPDEINLLLADLLNADSAQRYRDLLNAGVHKPEAEEGLAFLAARKNDASAAAELLRQAIADGSGNAAAMVEYAGIEPDAAKARAALEKAIAVDPNSADAHFLLGSKLDDPLLQIQQWKIATQLAPRNQQYWIALAKALAGQKLWPDAAKAWRGAEQAAPTSEERDKMMAARLAIEGQRLDFEDAERRRVEAEKQAEIDRLKQKAIAEIRAAEAKVNQESDPNLVANAVPWDQVNPPTVHVEGQMVRIDCTGRHMRITLRTSAGQTLKLDAEPGNLAFKNTTETKLACGPQKDRSVAFDYVAKANPRNGTAGDLAVVEFR
jgi:tetratricopeptide (TPR) repeat protein